MTELRNAAQIATDDVSDDQLLPIAKPVEKTGVFAIKLATLKAWLLKTVVSLPKGGTTGQVLTKTADDDYAAGWADPQGGGGGGGIPEAPTDGKTYGRKDAAWAEVTAGGGGGTVGLRSARYWKLSHFRTNTDTVGLQELTCYDKDGNVLPVSAIASRTAYNGDTVIGNIIDANKSNIYSSGNSALREWIYLDMGTSVPIARIALRVRNDSDGVNQFPTEFLLFAGDDNAKMQFVSALTNGVAGVAQGGTNSFFVPDASSAGGSSGGNMRPTIIQSGSLRTKGNGTLSLPAAPTVGNVLVWISHSYSGGLVPSALSKWARVLEMGSDQDYALQTARYQKAQIFMTTVTADMTKDFAAVTGDVGNAILLELDRVDAIHANSWRIEVDGNTGEGWVQVPKVAGDSIRIGFIEHDAVGAANFVTANLKGKKFDFNGTYNHAGQAYIFDKADPSLLKVGIGGPTYPNHLWLNIVKFG